MTEVERGGGNTDYAVILVHFVQSSHLNQLPAQFTNFIGKRRPSERKQYRSRKTIIRQETGHSK